MRYTSLSSEHGSNDGESTTGRSEDLGHDEHGVGGVFGSVKDKSVSTAPVSDCL
jgi:hypothetical protein